MNTSTIPSRRSRHRCAASPTAPAALATRSRPSTIRFTHCSPRLHLRRSPCSRWARHRRALVVTVGDNPDRLRSERAFAHLCGVAPIPASSGKTNRHRLHRGGDRSANRALHIAVIVRMRYYERTRTYVTRRTAEGMSKPEIIRCLKRYLAREIYRTILADYTALAAAT